MSTDSLSLTPAGGDEVEVIWTHPSDNGGGWVDTYRLEQKINAGAWSLVGTFAFGTTITTPATGAASGDTVSFRVRATKTALNSGWLSDSVVIP